MKKNWTPHGITVGAIVVFIVLGLACASEPPPNPHKWKGIVLTGEETPLLEGTTWTNINLGANVKSTTSTREFRSGGKLVIHGDTGNHFWQRTGDTVIMTIDDGYSYLKGTYYPETKKILGTGESSTGDEYKFDFTMELKQ